MFAHEKLQVYGKALEFAAQSATWTHAWEKRRVPFEGTRRFAAYSAESLEALPGPLFHHEVLEESAAVKGAVYLDLAVEKAL